MSTSLAARRDAQFQPAAEPNVIPFIDVLLVLLIIFMVTAPKPTVDLQIDLPVNPRPIAVVIAPTIVDLRPTRNGFGVFIGDQEIGLTALPGEVMARAMAADPVLTEGDVFAEAHVYVRASDQSIAYGAVVAALDELQNAGFAKVGVFAQSAEGGA
jgi:biopolymer transport protein ExbD